MVKISSHPVGDRAPIPGPAPAGELSDVLAGGGGLGPGPARLPLGLLGRVATGQARRNRTPAAGTPTAAGVAELTVLLRAAHTTARTRQAPRPGGEVGLDREWAMAGLALFAALQATFADVHPFCDQILHSSTDAVTKGDPGWVGRAACARHVAIYSAGQLVAAVGVTRALGFRVLGSDGKLLGWADGQVTAELPPSAQARERDR